MEEQSASPAGSGADTSGGSAQQGDPGKTALATLPGVLSQAAGKIAPVVEMLNALGLTAAAKPLQALADTLMGGSGKVQSIVDAVAANKENGAVGQMLGGGAALLGEIAPDGDGSSFLEKAQEKVSALSGIWNKFYGNMHDEEGKLQASKVANMAMEVGTVLLGSKKMAKIRKAYAIGETIVNTATAIVKTFSKYGFPGGVPYAAAMAAVGAKQISIIKGQAHDGLTNVPSTGTYLLEKGERVVGSRLNADLQGFLSAQNTGGDTSNVSNSSSVTNSPTINMTINGDAKEDAVHSNRGALESMIRDVFADYAMEPPFA